MSKIRLISMPDYFVILMFKKLKFRNIFSRSSHSFNISRNLISRKGPKNLKISSAKISTLKVYLVQYSFSLWIIRASLSIFNRNPALGPGLKCLTINSFAFYLENKLVCFLKNFETIFCDSKKKKKNGKFHLFMEIEV